MIALIREISDTCNENYICKKIKCLQILSSESSAGKQLSKTICALKGEQDGQNMRKNERHRPVEVRPAEGHKNDPGDQTPPLGRQAVRAGATQPREGSKRRDTFWYLKGGNKKEGHRFFSGVCCDRTSFSN